MRVILDDSGEPVPETARRAVRDVLRAAGRELGVGPGDVVVQFVGREQMQALNARWRGRDAPTDVLSFPLGVTAPDGRRHVGDIALCWPVALEQARRRRHPPEREAALLALHGLLHLLGWDHETDDGEMDTLERRLRRRLLEPAGDPR
ncbi:MAG: rRNA maturation RNase YbeY [Acidobacteriota bacterium]